MVLTVEMTEEAAYLDEGFTHWWERNKLQWKHRFLYTLANEKVSFAILENEMTDFNVCYEECWQNVQKIKITESSMFIIPPFLQAF